MLPLCAGGIAEDEGGDDEDEAEDGGDIRRAEESNEDVP
jgi:hypothetical protein